MLATARDRISRLLPRTRQQFRSRVGRSEVGRGRLPPFLEGGVYLDLKTTIRVPLDDVIRPDDRYLLLKRQGTGHPNPL